MTAAKVGDRVRATCGESVIVGVCSGGTLLHTPTVWVTPDGTDVTFIYNTSWTVEVLAPPIPDVVGTIVRDKDGDAWQCREGSWYLADNDDIGRSLNDLQFYGPLIVLWTPEDKS